MCLQSAGGQVFFVVVFFKDFLDYDSSHSQVILISCHFNYLESDSVRPQCLIVSADYRIRLDQPTVDTKCKEFRL